MEVNRVYNGTCLEVLKGFPDNSIDSCVTDPPYGISFMNKHWDYDVPKVEVWQEIYRVLKPGAHVLCACGTRTQHRMAVNIEDAGFEIRDVISWIYGSGFPKSLNVALAIDKQKGATGHRGKAFTTAGAGEREDIQGKNGGEEMSYTNPITDEAKEWNGWGTALKPATEFWTLARKPLSEKTVAENVLKYGTGGINIDGSRIEMNDTDAENSKNNWKPEGYDLKNSIYKYGSKNIATEQNNKGRFPANVIFDEFMGVELDKQTGVTTSGKNIEEKGTGGIWSASSGLPCGDQYGDSGGASRFFYCPKADNGERNKGLKAFDEKEKVGSDFNNGNLTDLRMGKPQNRNKTKNHHPTVKPIDLMRYLVKLITPKKGICLDPYCGSGTTLIGCKMELINYIGIEREGEYCKIAEARVAAWNPDKYKPQELF